MDVSQLTRSCSRESSQDTSRRGNTHPTYQSSYPQRAFLKQTSVEKSSPKVPISPTITAQTHGVAGISGPKNRQSSADKLSSLKAHRQRYDLEGVGSHSLNEGGNYYGTHISYSKEAITCPYHGSIVDHHRAKISLDHGRGPMDRYLAEDRSERYSILHQPNERGMLPSTACTCFDITRDSPRGTDRVHYG